MEPIPEEQKLLVVDAARYHPVLSPRELAVKLTDEQWTCLSESSVDRILKTKGLVTTPACIPLSASNGFKGKPCSVHQTWQTGFMYFKGLDGCWYCLSDILNDFRPL